MTIPKKLTDWRAEIVAEIESLQAERRNLDEELSAALSVISALDNEEAEWRHATAGKNITSGTLGSRLRNIVADRRRIAGGAVARLRAQLSNIDYAIDDRHVALSEIGRMLLPPPEPASAIEEAAAPSTPAVADHSVLLMWAPGTAPPPQVPTTTAAS